MKSIAKETAWIGEGFVAIGGYAALHERWVLRFRPFLPNKAVLLRV
jgi:hypothetical protein